LGFSIFSTFAAGPNDANIPSLLSQWLPPPRLRQPKHSSDGFSIADFARQNHFDGSRQRCQLALKDLILFGLSLTGGQFTG
jgi:hypothetical protein